MSRPTFTGVRGHVIVGADSQKAIDLVCRAVEEIWPEPNMASPMLRQALESGEVDERCLLTVEDAEMVAAAFRSIGEPAVAGAVMLAVLKSRRIPAGLTPEAAERLVDGLLAQAEEIKLRVCGAVDRIEAEVLDTTRGIWNKHG